MFFLVGLLILTLDLQTCGQNFRGHTALEGTWGGMAAHSSSSYFPHLSSSGGPLHPLLPFLSWDFVLFHRCKPYPLEDIFNRFWGVMFSSLCRA